MAEPVTAINGAQGTGTPPATRTRIHWGRVVKGVAAITAVAVVAVCGYWFASSFVATLLAGNPGLASAAATTGNMAGSFFSTISGWITGGLSAAGQFLGTFFTTLFPSLATTTAAAATIPPADPAAVGGWVGKAVAGATTFIAGLFAIKKVAMAPLLTVTADPSIMPTDQVTAYQATKTALKSAELAHHAAEHSAHHARHESPTQRNWVERSGIRHRPAASFAEKIAQEQAAATTLKR
jgi:hypothetical protein